VQFQIRGLNVFTSYLLTSLLFKPVLNVFPNSSLSDSKIFSSSPQRRSEKFTIGRRGYGGGRRWRLLGSGARSL